MQRFNHSVEHYIIDHTTQPDPLLQRLERETWTKVLRPQMVSGHLQGKTLEMFSRMIQPHAILELGTFTGYSALCLAKGLAPGGQLITIDINDELEEFATSFFNQSAQAAHIKMLTGDARQIVPTLPQLFDLVFIDADKRQYPEYYQLIFDKVKPGGFILADDVLWYGKINDEAPTNDSYTLGLQQFNAIVRADNRVETLMLPIRDGLMVIYKKEG
jgi:caffeoyl-CoA O-methyltransferase